MQSRAPIQKLDETWMSSRRLGDHPTIVRLIAEAALRQAGYTQNDTPTLYESFHHHLSQTI